MAVLHSYYCRECDAETHDKWEPPTCCGKDMRILFVKVNTPEWGSPRTYLHLRDEPFESRSELNRYARDNNLTLENDSAEKVGGSRNDMYDGMGKLYSYKGASSKQSPSTK